MIPFIITTIEDPNDREFMASLYISYSRLIFSEIHKYVQNDWDVEDILQSVLIKLIGKIPLLRSFDRNQQVNYIIVTARNTAFNFLRDNKRATEFSYNEDLDWVDDKFPSNDDRLESIERMEDVKNAWHALDERSKNLLEMKYILDLPNEEIARAVGVSTNSVRMLLTRARNKLKENLSAEEFN